MVLERPDIINRFIHYYQGIGASHLALYHDGAGSGRADDGRRYYPYSDGRSLLGKSRIRSPADHILRQLIAYEESVRTDASRMEPDC